MKLKNNENSVSLIKNEQEIETFQLSEKMTDSELSSLLVNFKQWKNIQEKTEFEITMLTNYEELNKKHLDTYSLYLESKLTKIPEELYFPNIYQSILNLYPKHTGYRHGSTFESEIIFSDLSELSEDFATLRIAFVSKELKGNCQLYLTIINGENGIEIVPEVDLYVRGLDDKFIKVDNNHTLNDIQSRKILIPLGLNGKDLKELVKSQIDLIIKELFQVFYAPKELIQIQNELGKQGTVSYDFENLIGTLQVDGMEIQLLEKVKDTEKGENFVTSWRLLKKNKLYNTRSFLKISTSDYTVMIPLVRIKDDMSIICEFIEENYTHSQIKDISKQSKVIIPSFYKDLDITYDYIITLDEIKAKKTWDKDGNFNLVERPKLQISTDVQLNSRTLDSSSLQYLISNINRGRATYKQLDKFTTYMECHNGDYPTFKLWLNTDTSNSLKYTVTVADKTFYLHSESNKSCMKFKEELQLFTHIYGMVTDIVNEEYFEYILKYISKDLETNLGEIKEYTLNLDDIYSWFVSTKDPSKIQMYNEEYEVDLIFNLNTLFIFGYSKDSLWELPNKIFTFNQYKNSTLFVDI